MNESKSVLRWSVVAIATGVPVNAGVRRVSRLYLFSGVRPSSGAAALEASETGSSAGAFGVDTFAAAEDGSTPAKLIQWPDGTGGSPVPPKAIFKTPLNSVGKQLIGMETAAGGGLEDGRAQAVRRWRSQFLKEIGECLFHARGILDFNARDFQPQNGKTHRDAVVVVSVDLGGAAMEAT